MTRVKKAVVALLAVTVALGNATSASVAPTESFDKPVRKTIVNLGLSLPNAKKTRPDSALLFLQLFPQPSISAVPGP
jgi:hypothetical protein